MAKYRKKPVVIEAWCVNDLITASTFNRPLPAPVAEMVAIGVIKLEVNGASVLTKEGRMHANANDMLICGVAGEFYPCKPDIFAATYEVAHDPSCQIPDEAVEAGVTAFKRAFMAGRKDAMKAAITACLEAWQGSVIRPPFLPNHIILPLPQEVSDE